MHHTFRHCDINSKGWRSTMNRRDLTLEELHDQVGAPLDPALVVMRRNGPILETAWETRMCDSAGWAWCISMGTTLIAQGWTSGNRRDRDVELARAVSEFRSRRAA